MEERGAALPALASGAAARRLDEDRPSTSCGQGDGAFPVPRDREEYKETTARGLLLVDDKDPPQHEGPAMLPPWSDEHVDERAPVNPG
jgi:hypothetical protein